MADSSKHVEENVEKLLKKYPELLKDKETNKLKCSLSGHEMPCTAVAINTYVNGKKFKKLREKNQFSYEDHKNNLVPSIKKFHEKHLYCFLTQSHINNEPEAIQRFISGRKYNKAFAEWKRCQEAGERYQVKKYRHGEDGEDGVTTDGSEVTGDGGVLDSDNETYSKMKKKDEEEDNFSDLYPDDSDDGQAGSGSDYDFKSIEDKEKPTTGIKPKVVQKKHIVKKTVQKESNVKKKTKKDKNNSEKVTSVPKKFSKVSKVTKRTLPNKKKLKRLASS